MGIAGHKEAGKSSLAKHLAAKIDNSIIAPLAAAVRSELIWAINDGIIPEEMPEDIRNHYRKLQAMTDLGLKLAINNKPTHPSARKLLQWWGTDYRRAQEENYWIDRLNEVYKTSIEDPTTIVFVDDVRFKNEVDFIHKHKGNVLWLERDTELDNHISERAISPSDCDITIDSNCELGEMLAKGERLMKGII